MADSTEFVARKAIGTSAETALKDLLTAAGAIVTMNQQNRDAVSATAGAAIAHLADGTQHLPDLTALFPSRHVARRMGMEVKAKSPLRRGGWGWDRHAFDRAFRWSVLTGEPTLYVIRNLDAAPLPAAGELDDADHWSFASVWKLMHSPSRAESGEFIYWPADDFLPLGVLLENLYDAALVPVVWVTDGPPIIL